LPPRKKLTDSNTFTFFRKEKKKKRMSIVEELEDGEDSGITIKVNN
jgi:hypothetical protein